MGFLQKKHRVRRLENGTITLLWPSAVSDELYFKMDVNETQGSVCLGLQHRYSVGQWIEW